MKLKVKCGDNLIGELSDSFAFSIGGQSKPWRLKKNNFHLLEGELGLKSGTMLHLLEKLIVELILVLPEVEDVCSQTFGRTFIAPKISQHIQKMVRVFVQRLF